MSKICPACGNTITGAECEYAFCPTLRKQKAPVATDSRSPIAVVGAAIMAAGAYTLAVFSGAALHVAKNGVGDGSMPSLSLSVTLAIVGLVVLTLGFALSGKWLRNPDDPISSFELFSVLICDPVPFFIGIYYLVQGRSRGARLLLTHALLVFVKSVVAAIAWNPNL